MTTTKKATRYHNQIEREVDKSLSKFSEHLMSNSKWVKLIDKLVDKIDLIKKIEFKKVQHDVIGELLLEKDTTYEFDYWHNGFEGHNSLGGILSFREIEYLIFPKIVDDSNKKEIQNLDEIKKVIDSVGQFFLDIDENRIKLICYK